MTKFYKMKATHVYIILYTKAGLHIRNTTQMKWNFLVSKGFKRLDRCMKNNIRQKS